MLFLTVGQKKYLLFATVFFIFNSLLFAELTKTQMWAISLTGIMTETNRSYRNSLNASTMDETGRNIWLEVLRRDWGITTREELLETLDIMESDGHAASFREIQEIIYEIKNGGTGVEVIDILSKFGWDQVKIKRLNFVITNWDQYQNRTIKSWDLGRNISLCRWGYNVGFITYDEAWEKIFHYASIIKLLYNSWEEYGYDYMMGRLFWASGFGEEERYLARTEPVYKQLLNSYWSWIDWKIDLNQSEKYIPVNTIRFLKPDDNDGTLQYMTNDPVFYDRFYFNYSLNPNTNPNIYECRIKKISGSEVYGYGILFFVDDADKNNVSYYRLFITVNGMFAVAKRIGNAWSASTPVPWRNSQFIKTGFDVYNTIRVERADNENGAAFRIFFNDNHAITFNDNNPINGTKAGLVVSVNIMEMEQFPFVPVDVRFDWNAPVYSPPSENINVVYAVR
jgi:hypothetical protein